MRAAAVRSSMRAPRTASVSLRRRLTLWLLLRFETCAASVRPMGPIERRILRRIDRIYARMAQDDARWTPADGVESG